MISRRQWPAAAMAGAYLYGMSKAGLRYFAQSLALELAPSGPRQHWVARICGNPSHAQLLGLASDKQSLEAMFKATLPVSPIGRYGTADDIAWHIAHWRR